MTEQNLVEGAQAITSKIKIRLLEKGMSQIELSELISEGPQQVNRAIHADTSPKSVNIRQKIYRVLDIKE
ncbi:helix-turn-helix transcriptional regulator [Levilactobacillus brevis]|uniref:Helix-turn-helix transcriptional regulator n=1 Tax=Levilactobacillus brevis TaxID=1580 RepID=A0AA41ERD5_LEVBR|nr:helix-turn-helix transcriptional regulator [Levilactobacillus brevis]MBS0948341.1 helix-turn-helix transcriptional regulator [Levilactobacillus brevis]MBS1011486.1 helix-turn-helix transcriptional regulator [Levilactobacillus brevis]